MAQQIAIGLYPVIQVARATLDSTDAWLTAAEPTPALHRLVTESRAGIERALNAQAADAAAAA
jgi:aminopeptidase N